MIKSCKLLVVVLFVCSVSFAKAKSEADYPTEFTVISMTPDQALTGSQWNRCNMSLKSSDGFYYVVNSNGFCTSFGPGSVVHGKRRSFLSQDMIELVWTNDKGKVHACKYYVLSVTQY